ncbi:MAG: type IX secretion system membrane protein PorP/SprF, partial [Bacteroidetes bacterium]
MKRNWGIYALLLLMPVLVMGQDPHLSQFYTAGTFYNPAAQGRFEGQLRLSGSYRQQWASVASPFTTSFAQADFNLGQIGMGLSLINDGAGSASLNHLNVLAGVSYEIDLQPHHHLALGVQAGFIQKSFNPDKLSFDSQYDPDLGFDPGIPSGEIFPNTRLTVGDVHAGMLYRYKAPSPRRLMKAEMGFSLAHLNEPQLSFFGEQGQLPIRWAVHGRWMFLGNERMLIGPALLYMQQGTAREINLGALLDYEFDQEVFLHAGMHYRLGDALIPYLGMTINQLRFGFSYDITSSALATYNQMQGGYELSLTYVLGKAPAPKTNYAARKQLVVDTDGDGIKDHKDKCPGVAGLKKFFGCPDTDGDGIADSQDLCPTVPGLPEKNGCPVLDRDGDGIMDRNDICPDLPGLPAFKGCPDTDGDGLPDNLDACPNAPGLRERNGCPSSDIDADGDGIPDKIDQCPTVPGLAQFQGCPDTDGDGISDLKDSCPDLPGLPANFGCPVQQADADKDGIPDAADACPMVAGLPALQGCPDTDGDGVSDFKDRCPMIAGPAENEGCPNQNMDADGDGVLNSVDKCPYVPGLPAFMGCPDTDKDGISDLEDECPLIHGPIANKGCPLSGQVHALPKAAKQPPLPEFGPILFDTDQAVIKAAYFPILNELAAYMLEHPGLKLQITGHTDDEGNEAYNMMLGQNRAKAVTYYLTVRGIDPDRISYSSLGEIMPVTDNNTE